LNRRQTQRYDAPFQPKIEHAAFFRAVGVAMHAISVVAARWGCVCILPADTVEVGSRPFCMLSLATPPLKDQERKAEL